MRVSRRVLLILPLTAATALGAPTGAPAASAPAVVIQGFYDVLRAVMKDAKWLSFDERYQRLAPAIARTFDLALMSRIAVGPQWTQLRPDQQERVSAAFSRYTVSVYANRFDDYGGERFEVDPEAATTANGVLVHTRLVKSNGEKVELDYLMRERPGGPWQVIDVYLSGTISELATRRSEFLAVLQKDGADGLVRMLDSRTAALRTG